MDQLSGQTWAQDLVEYFRELGGQAHYSDLYRHIESNPRRELRKEWQAVVRRTIEEHSSDTSIWNKRRLPDLFRSVDGLGNGRWALRDYAPDDFALKPGDRIKRTDLHARYGGSKQGGMTSSTTSSNVFLFSDPETGSEHGYVDSWKDDGCFHYTGMGQVGDQTMTSGNASALNHKQNGKALRLFDGSGGVITYVGRFEIDDADPFYRDYRPDRTGAMRWVFVFRLRPVGGTASTHIPEPLTTLPAVTEIPVEKQHLERMLVTVTAKTTEAERRESTLVVNFAKYIQDKTLTVSRNRIVGGPESGPFLTDVYIKEINLLIEAKGTTERNAFRMALGQLADYRRFLNRPRCAILLPSKPAKDLLALADTEDVGVIWPSGDAFESTIKIG